MESVPRPNRQLRLQRRLHGWSQEDVAAGLHRLAASLGEPELGVDATMVSRWERGTRRPRPRYVRLLCRLFELPAEQLGVVDEDALDPVTARSQDALEDDDVQRRDFIHRLAALLGTAGVPVPAFDQMGAEPWERLARALRQPGQVGDETVDHLEGVTITLQRLGPARVSSRAMLGPVTNHLNAITLLLQGSLPPSRRARLCSLAAETAGIAGWLRWNVDDAAGAAWYFGTALDAAREGGDRALEAYLAGSAACQPPDRETPRRRLDLLRDVAWSDATPATRAWLAAKEADAHALLGDAGGCLRALDRAERALDEAPRADVAPRPRTDAIDRTWLEGERGASLAKLGRTAEARQILQAVLDRLGEEKERDRLWLGTALASTYAQDREPEEACRVAGSVLERAAEMGLDPVMRLVEALYQQLGAHGPRRAVGELGELLRVTRGS